MLKGSESIVDQQTFKIYFPLVNGVMGWIKAITGAAGKWFARTSPFVILSIVTAFLLLYQLIFQAGGPDEWRHPLLVHLLFFVFLLVVLDVVLKHFIKKNYWLWIIESVLCLGLIYYWIIT